MTTSDPIATRRAVPPQAFRMPWRKSLGILSTAGALVLAGLELLRRGTWPLGGWVTIASGAVLGLWFGQPAWRRAPMLWFDDRGLFARVPGIGPIPWQAIERVRLVRVNGKSSFLVVDRTPEERARRPLGPLGVAIAKKPEAKDLAVPLDHLEVAPDKVFAVVDLAHRHALGRS